MRTHRSTSAPFMARPAAIVVGLLCWLAQPAGVRAQPSLVDPALDLSVFLDGLSEPTGLAFTGNGSDLFVIEKATGLVRLASGGSLTTVLDLPVNSDSERGLLGIALHPQFATNGHAYFYYSRANGGDGGSWLENRLSRFTWNGTQFGGETVFRSWAFDATQANGPNHDGGPLRFGPDGTLYGATGDLNRGGIEQNNTAPGTVSADAGGIFRFNDDGTLPADNPFLSTTDTRLHPWYAYGVRNSFGLAFDPATGLLWDTENGPGSYDEVNVVARGFNSGWTKLMGPDSRDPQGVGDLVSLPNSAYSDPEFSWRSPIGVTSIGFLPTSLLNKTYGDGALVGDNNTGGLYFLPLNEARDGFALTGDLADLVADSSTERNSLRFGSDFSVVTDIQVGPDGALYVSSYGNGEIYRIAPDVLPLLGDANDDGEVGAADYAIWAAQFGQTGVGLAADWDRNLSVGAGDYALWAANFGNTQAGASVPEPASGVLAAVGAVIGWLSIVRGRIRRTS